MAKYKDSLYPDKINDLIGNDGEIKESAQDAIAESVNKAIEEGGIEVPGAEAEGNILKISKIIKAPKVPLKTVDGIDYYNVNVFDMSQITFSESKYDLITGELLGNNPTQSYLYAYYHGAYDAQLIRGTRTSSTDLYQNNTSIEFSKAYQVLNTGTLDDVGQDQILIPNCTNFYLESGDGLVKCYYNLPNQDLYEILPVQEISDGKNKVNIQDLRFPDTDAVADGRMIVSEGGKAIWKEVKLGLRVYQHIISFRITGDSSALPPITRQIRFLSNSAEKVTSLQGVFMRAFVDGSANGLAWNLGYSSGGNIYSPIVAIHMYSGGQYFTYDGVIIVRYTTEGESGNTTATLFNINFGNTSTPYTEWEDVVTEVQNL